jgi:putative ABC transport system permease protein
VNASVAGALLRIGRRNVGRSRWRSLLVVVLVLLPVAGMVAAGTILKTVTPTPERVATGRMGAADLMVNSRGDGTLQLLEDRLPKGAFVEPLLQTAGRLQLPGLLVSVTVDAHDPAGLAKGLLTLVAGRYPASAGEAAITAEVARLAKASVGDRIQLAELGSIVVVGLVEDELRLDARTVLLDPAAAKLAEATKEASWLVRLPPGSDARAVVGDLSAPVSSDPIAEGGEPSPAFSVTARADLIRDGADIGPATVVLGGLGLVDAALVAAAAFGVGVRRRQRELGLMAATGAEPRHVMGSVLAEALVLGGIGAAAGAIVGLIGALAASPFLDGLTEHRNPAIALDTPILLIAGAMGALTAVIAAVAPAWAAARLPVLAALSGSRPNSRSARRTLLIGLGLVAIAIAATGAGAAMRLAGETGSLSLALLLGGAVLGTLGFGACSPWLLERLEKRASRLPLPARIAVRDTARARSRNGPIATALLAAFAATVALAAYQASLAASYAASWQPAVLPDQLLFQGPGASEGGAAAALELDAIASAPIPGAGGDQAGYVWISPAGSNDPNDALSVQNVTTGDANLLRALGADSAITAFEAGTVVLLSNKPSDVQEVTLHVVGPDGSELQRGVIPARMVVTVGAGDLPGAVLPAAVATRFNIPAGKNAARFVIRLAHPVTDAEMGRAGVIAAGYPDTWVDWSHPPEVSGASFRIVLIVASLVFALTVTAVAVALGEAESRPEQRTLLAIGADPALRRRITAARAGVIALVGGLLAVPAGLLPVWGLLASRGSPLVVPVPEVAGAVLLLPVLAILGAWLLSRPIPEWAAFRDLPVT